MLRCGESVGMKTQDILMLCGRGFMLWYVEGGRERGGGLEGRDVAFRSMMTVGAAGTRCLPSFHLLYCRMR